METPEGPPRQRSTPELALRLLVTFSLGVLVLRVQALRGLGLADAEALFVSYALHPQPVYLQHPGLVGVVMRWIGSGTAPDPATVHLSAAVLAALVPIVAWLGARGTGASWSNAVLAALASALLPAFIVGHSSLSPGLLLALVWTGAVGCAAVGVRADRGTWAALLGWLAAGVLAGMAVMSHVCGGLLALTLLGGGLASVPRPRWFHPPIWAAGIVASILAAPVVTGEIASGFSLARSHLFGTAIEPTLLHGVWTVTGFVVLLTPFPLLAAFVVAKDLAQQRGGDAVSRLLWVTTITSAAMLLPLAAWSPLADPSWLLPCLVPLFFHLARRPVPLPRWISAGCLATGIAATVGAWTWVKTDLLVSMLGRHYPRHHDTATELHTWGPGRQLLADALAATVVRRRELPVVVGIEAGTCAQAHAAVGHQVRVGCLQWGTSDFDRWLPPSSWLGADSVLLVYDDRFAEQPTTLFPDHAAISFSKVEVRRAGRVLRTIRVVALDKIHGIAGR